MIRLTQLFAAVLLLTFIQGCGESQQDKMMRAAQRPRPSADEDDDVDVSAESTPLVVNSGNTNSQGQFNAASTSASNAVASNNAPNSASNLASSETSNPGISPESVVADNLLPPISERRPAEPLSDFERRKMAADNLKKIGAAFAQYLENNKRVPARGIKAKSGVITLSWRVELLPYLGYQDLYKQFDPNQPWDGPKNLPLLDRIPDCYVSPERFDSNTNYLGITGKRYLMQDSPTLIANVEDGLENTLAVLEVDDAFAVPWTSPMDYEPEYGAANAGIGNLRPEGTYGLWANGWTTLLKKGVGEQQLHKAFTYESLDGLVAGDIHTALMIRDTASSLASDSQKPVASNVKKLENQADGKSLDNVNPEKMSATEFALNGKNGVLPRLPVPNRSAVSDAVGRVKQLFGDRLRPMGNRERLRDTGQEMLRSAEGMRSDPAGAFALQATAIDIAIQATDLELLLRALDHHVAMFEVDAVETHADALAKFGKQNGGALAESVDAREYMTAVVPIIYGLTMQDKFDVTEDLTQFATMYESRSGNREFLVDLNRLKSQLQSAKNFFQRSGAALGQLRSNPEDPAACYAVGRYLTFIKGDWDTGLPILAMGENERLAQMAKADLAAAGASSEQVLANADAWWELGEETSNQLFKGACRERAAHWYQIAIRSLPESLSKLHAKSRLEECTNSVSGSPIVSLKTLAEDMGMDIQSQLLAIKEPQTMKQTIEEDVNAG